MKTLTSAQLFAAPKKAHKTKAWLERAKLVVVAARGARQKRRVMRRSLRAQCPLLQCCRDADWSYWRVVLVFVL